MQTTVEIIGNFTETKVNTDENGVSTLKIKGDISKINDGYHDVNELYSHRIILFVCLAKLNKEISWKSRIHNDGTSIDGWFISGMSLPTGDITYHIPDNFWGMLEDVKTLEKSPEWDGHSSEDVIRRLNNWCFTLK